MNRLSIPSTLISAKLSQNVADIRARINDVSAEAVTGRRADLTSHLSGRIGDAMLSQKALLDLTDEQGALSLREARIDLAQQSLGRIQTTTDGLSARLLSAVGFEDQPEIDAVARDAASALDTLVTSLNARHGERYLFAGDATSTQPFAGKEQLLDDVRQIAVDASDPADFEARINDYFNSPTGGWQQTIYQGDAATSDPDGVTAIDPSITKLVSGLAVMAIGGQDDSPGILGQSSGALELAAERVSEGQTDLTTARASLGVIQERIADSQKQLETEETILTEAFNSITSRDQYEAASELRELESNLEASYLLTARLSNLNLMNFLR